jgi:hypothetical protein
MRSTMPNRDNILQPARSNQSSAVDDTDRLFHVHFGAELPQTLNEESPDVFICLASNWAGLGRDPWKQSHRALRGKLLRWCLPIARRRRASSVDRKRCDRDKQHPEGDAQPSWRSQLRTIGCGRFLFSQLDPCKMKPFTR